MRERLREHSAHLEAQHREVSADSASDPDDDAGTRDVAGTSRETSLSNGASEASVEDDLDDRRDNLDEGGGFDSDAARTDAYYSSAREASPSRATGSSATPEGRRLVDLVRAEAAARCDAAKTPSQRRVDALLRIERRAEAARERGRGGDPGRGGWATRSGLFDFAGRFFGRASDARADGAAGDDGAPLVPPKAARLSEKQAARLFHRLYSEKKKPAGRDPDETFKPRISRKTRAMGADVHARENGGLPRVEYLSRKGTSALRARAARTAELERLGGREKTAESADARVIDPSLFFLDRGSGRPVKPGDSCARAIGALGDARTASDESVCTFKPKLTEATRAIAAARDAADPAAARRGPLGMYARGLEFMERRKREAAAAQAARVADEEKECTFRPRAATRVPGFMRVIAAKMRRARDAAEALDPEEVRGAPGGPAGAAVSAARRREGWLSSPTFSLSGWAESLGIRAGSFARATRAGDPTPGFGSVDGRATDADAGAFVADVAGASATIRAGAVSFPSAPADHPARRRAGAHVPIKSAAGHYGFRNEGKRSTTVALEDARLAARAAEAAHAANLESLFGDVADFGDGAAPPASPGAARAASGSAGYYRDVRRRADGGVRGRLLGSTSAGATRGARDARLRDAWRSAESRTSVAETDYFERKHLERKQLARLEAAEKAARLTRHDGSGWRNRVTEPRAPALGRKPDMSKVTALRRPVTSKTSWSAETGGRRGARHSISNSVSDRGDRGFADARTPAAAAGAAPAASLLAARAASRDAMSFRDGHRGAPAAERFPFGHEPVEANVSGAARPRGPPGWSDAGVGRGGGLGAAESARRAGFGGSGTESERNFQDDFEEFRSEGEYDSAFE